MAQFGKGDKYFGVCTMLATLPGLPMVGHGQLEGLTEKYGMEFRRAYRDEQPDDTLVQRHEREIFPLLRRRHLFAEIEHFLLYDFFTSEGHVNEDVFAYSNRSGSDRALVIYHNKYASTGGWIRTSVGFLGKTGTGDARTLMQKDLGTGLGLHADASSFCIFRDRVTNLEYIRNCRELFEKGLYFELGAYKCHVFLEFREVCDDAGRRYSQLASYLDGRGVPSIDEAVKEIFLLPIHQPFKELVNPKLLRQLMDARLKQPRENLDKNLLDGVQQKFLRLARAIKEFTGSAGDEGAFAREIRQKLAAILELPILESRLPALAQQEHRPGATSLQATMRDDPIIWGSLFGWLFVHNLGRMVDETNFAQRSRSWIDEWLLGPIIAGALQDLGLGDLSARQIVALVKLLTSHQDWFATQATETAGEIRVLESLLKDGGVQQFLQVNRYQDILWFNKEAFDQLLSCLWLLAAIDVAANPDRQADTVTKDLVARHGTIRKLQQAAEKSECQIEKLLAATKNR